MIDLTHSCKVVPLIGNHEKMMMLAQENDTALKEWLGYGGRATLESGAPGATAFALHVPLALETPAAGRG